MKSDVKLKFPAGGRTTLPFKRGEGHLLLDMEDAAGNGLRFILDTGAGQSILLPRFLEVSDTATPVGGNGGKAVGSHGVVSEATKPYQVDGLRLGDLVIERLSACVVDLSQLEKHLGVEIHGILGRNVLAAMIVLIDYQKSEVTFIDPSSVDGAFADADHRLDFSLRMDALIELSGSVNGGPDMPFIFDTGSPITFLNGIAAADSGIDFTAGEEDKIESCSDGQVPLTMTAGRADVMAFGGLEWQGIDIKSIDLPVFGQLGLAESPAGLVGNDRFRDCRIAIDYAAGNLHIWQPPAGHEDKVR